MTFPATTGTVATLNTANAFSVNQVISVTDNTNPALRITQLGTGNAFVVEDSANPDATSFVINNAGQVIAGGTTARTFSSSVTPLIQVEGTTTSNSSFGAANWSSSASTGGSFRLAKSKSNTEGTPGIVASGDTIGSFNWAGDDGVGFISLASISAFVDGTPGVNDMPGRIVFSTTSDGAATVTDRWQIDSSGYLKSLSGSFGRGAPVTKSNDFTVAATENWLINDKAGSTCTVTLPAASSWTGREIMFLNYQTQTVVSASSNVVPLAGGAAGTAMLAATAGKWCTVVSDGTNWIVTQAS
jgi:hypothetical protein